MTLQPATSWPVSANGSQLKCLGAFVADVVVGPRLIQNKVKVLVVENLSAPGIWGTTSQANLAILLRTIGHRFSW